MGYFKLRHQKRQALISERDVRPNDFRTPRCISKIRYDLEFQSRDKWSLNNYGATEIKSKGFLSFKCNNTIQYRSLIR